MARKRPNLIEADAGLLAAFNRRRNRRVPEAMCPAVQPNKGVFDRSDEECDIPICFKPEDPANQQNAVHTSLIGFVRDPSIADGRALAERLRDHTTSKSGLGLLFFIVGSEGRTHKLVVSRFP